MEVITFLKEVKCILQAIGDLYSKNKENEAFQVLNQQIETIQEYILFLANNEVIPSEDINQISLLLVRAMKEKDSVLLLDVCKYALLEVADQLLEGCEGECE